MFADFFQSVYTTQPADTNILAFINNRDDNSCANISFTPEAVYSVLSRMDLNKGSGHDGISSIFLRECADILSDPLCKLYTMCMEKGIYPDLFKIGQITAIHKSGPRNDVTNHRGVCVLPNLSKVYEKLLNPQLRMIITPRISKTQHGFLSNRNIETNLMELTTLAHRAFDENAQLDVFYSDISKAFDCVDPSRLIRKLAKFPINNKTLRLLASYLDNRSQYVKCNNSKSGFFRVSSGVGQGSILGPLLFIAFFNDSDQHFDKDKIFPLNFADDKKIAAIIRRDEDTNTLQEAISQFIDWCSDNGLECNQSKCSIMTFTQKRTPIIHNYQMMGQPIKRVNEIRDLGVILDKKLNFNSHIEYAINKSKAALQLVKRQSYLYDSDVTKLLYTALVRSNIEFACAIWSPHHNTQKSNIESIQKQMLIYLNGDHLNRSNNNYRLSPYIDRCNNFGFTTLARRRVNLAVLFAHSVIMGRYINPNLRALMQLNTGIRTLRRPEFIRLKSSNTNTSIFSSFNNACRAFNHAALFIDPTLPHHEFRVKLLALPDTAFGDFTKL